MKYLYLFLLFMINNILASAQVSGKVTDANGEPLPFTNIYVQGTSNGTTTNIEGDYEFELEKGTYKLVFQFVGFKPKVETFKISNQPIKLNVVLEAESFGLNEIVVAADAEDPAYEIIRQAQKKRKYYKEQVYQYQCNVYIKGGIKLLDVPKKILGRDLGDLGGQLDSNRQGIVYLSESEAILNFRQPDQYKEIMTSSKVSGDDNGFSFNRASEMDFNLYENSALYFSNREVVSPIANNAFNYYRYKLLGTFYDEKGLLINKIEILPKRKEDPSYGGILYIVDKLWVIQSTELFLTAKSIKQAAVDTMWLKQLHVPVAEPDVWKMFSQTISFTGGYFGFKLKGDFTGIFKNYNLHQTYKKDFFDNEVLVFEKGANEKTLDYWQESRPIPLTEEESIDYVKKDSLSQIWDSKEYKDSIDNKNNQFKLTNVLFGYSYRNSWKRRSFSVRAPISTFQFNPVQGGTISFNFNYRKAFDERNLSYYRFNPKVQYGFGDKKLRARFSFFRQFNATNFSKFYFSGGREAMQFNSDEPIKPTLSAMYNLWGKENLMKLYNRDFLYLLYGKEIRNGISIRIASEFAQRSPLQINTQYSWKKKEEVYSDNEPQVNELDDFSFEKHSIFYLDASIRIRFAQKYLAYPDRKYIMGSKYPTFRIRYQKAIPFNSNFSGFDKISLSISEDYIGLGVNGHSEFNIKAGTFFNKKRMQVVDYQHFGGNETFIGNPNIYANSFLRLPYYSNSTADGFFEAHYQHHFDGFFMDKVPLIRKLGWQLAMGVNFLYTESEKDYSEVYLGIDNIGVKIFRLFRVDVVSSFRKGKFDNVGVVLGVKI